MPSATQPEEKKIEAAVYLASNRPLHLPQFVAEFHRTWPQVVLQKTGKEPHGALFRAGKSNFALEIHHQPVPREVTEPVVDCTLHWPMAASALARHQAHLSVTGSTEDGDVLSLARDLTKAIAALIPVTDSLAVCWLNGPSLNPAQSFAETAREMYATGLHPVKLWVGIRWDQAGVLQTIGMAQFGAPEICFAKQPDPAPLIIDYMWHVAQSVLSSNCSIANGHTLDGPHGRLKIKKSEAAGKRILIFEPS